MAVHKSRFQQEPYRSCSLLGRLSVLTQTGELITSGLPVIRPEPIPSAEITSYKPTYRDLADLDIRRRLVVRFPWAEWDNSKNPLLDIRQKRRV